ncbi:MAG: hypothetical protein HFF84_15930 [Oscillibacter sp.]|nr:hypothetical protein [Oscillibacter sp.]
MGTLQSGIELYDGFSAPLYSMINALNLTVSAFEDMQRISGNQIDTSSIDGARAAADEATMAFQAMQDELSRIGATGGTVTAPTVSPVEAPVVWKSDTLDVFTNSGIDRFEQEIQSANSMLERLGATQTSITQQAQAINILPPEAITDIQNLQNRVQDLQAAIIQVEQNSLDVGSDEANAQLERLRAQLAQTLAYQENLNAAMQGMNVGDINSAFLQLSQNVGNVERSIRDGFSQPIEIPVTWNAQGIEVFTNSGVERFQQEVQSATDMMNALNQAQQQISAQAAATNIFPPDAVTDLSDLQNRIQALQNRMTQIANNPINMGSDTANRELEQLRAQLNQAIAAQEALNGAVEHMDVQAANDAYNRLSQIIGGTERNIRDNVDEQGRFNDAINEGANAAQNLSDIIQKAVAGFAGIAGVKKAFDYIQSSTDLFNTQLNAEIQLSTVLGNMLESNVGGAFDAITAKASEIQSRGIYGDEAMIAGAAELATYFSDADAVMSMMDTLSNYSMGMSGGGAVDSKAMVDYATGIGKIMSGSYGAMTKKGFEFSDTQKAIIEGTATEAQIVSELGAEYLSMSADMQAAAAINNVIEEGWGGLYEAMSNTPQGKIIQLSNAYGDLKEQVGAGVYPFIVKIVDAVAQNWGMIEIIISNVTAGLQLLVGILGWIAEGAINAATAIIGNWSWIGPIVYGAAGAVLFYLAVTKGVAIAERIAAIATAAYHTVVNFLSIGFGILTGNTAAASAAMFTFNSALMASPITWIIISIITLVAVIYAAVGAVNHFVEKSYSATGIIAGAFAVLGAHIINTFIVPFWNSFAAIANFLGNVFNDPVAAVKVLFYDMALTVIGYIKNMAEAIETVINKIPGVTVDITSGLDSFYNGLEAAQQQVKDESGWMEYVQQMDFIDYRNAATAGYAFGKGIDDTISGFSLYDLFNVDQLNMDDYISAYDAAGNGLTSDVSDIAGNTGSIADSLDVTDEELKYLRDIAERDTINRFTIAEVAVDMGGITNQVNGPADLDGLVDGIVDGVNEAIDIVTEGVHT